MPTTYTPLRYPGGKSGIYPFVRQLIADKGLKDHTYTEPFAGGAGLAVKLLLKGDVRSIHINDLDPAVFSFWHSVVNRPLELCHLIDSTPVCVEEWKNQREVFQRPQEQSILEVGFATLYLNRTNVSGVLKGGVVGGFDQTGSSKINARFNKETLKRKIKTIAAERDRIQVTCEDAHAMLSGGLFESKSFLNIDPPYVRRGPDLYRNFFTLEDHAALQRAVASLKCPWMLTYDDTDYVRDLYCEWVGQSLPISYSIGSIRKATEVVFFSHDLTHGATLSEKAS